MRFRTFNGSGDRECLFVMGWGNRWTHRTVRWLIDELAAGDYRVHVAQLPTRLTDFRADWLEPVAEYARDLDPFALLSHSAGGLVAPSIDGAETHVYMSPFWGYSPTYPRWALELIARVPTSVPFIPARPNDPAVLGKYARAERVQETPSWLSPTFVRETRDAQSRLFPANANLAAIAESSRRSGSSENGGEGPQTVNSLPTPRWYVEDDAVVFCSLSDAIIDLQAIGDRVDSSHVVLYEGGHELFASTSRDRHLPTVLAALEEGASAVR